MPSVLYYVYNLEECATNKNYKKHSREKRKLVLNKLFVKNLRIIDPAIKSIQIHGYFIPHGVGSKMA